MAHNRVFPPTSPESNAEVDRLRRQLADRDSELDYANKVIAAFSQRLREAGERLREVQRENTELGRAMVAGNMVFALEHRARLARIAMQIASNEGDRTAVDNCNTYILALSVVREEEIARGHAL